jgi:hypothetical protein
MNQPESPEQPKVERCGDITVITFTAGTIRDEGESNRQRTPREYGRCCG